MMMRHREQKVVKNSFVVHMQFGFKKDDLKEERFQNTNMYMRQCYDRS